MLIIKGGQAAGSLSSLLAELQSQTALLTTMDADTSAMATWNEAARAAINLIVGQIGITAGAGAVAANTPRVILASMIQQ